MAAYDVGFLAGFVCGVIAMGAYVIWRLGRR